MDAGHDHYCRLSMTPLQRNSANIRIYLIFSETTIIGLHFATDSINLSLLNFFLTWAP